LRKPLYIAGAVLLGFLIILAPMYVVKWEERVLTPLRGKGEEAVTGYKVYVEKAASPFELLNISLLTIFSILLALGVSLYTGKKLIGLG